MRYRLTKNTYVARVEWEDGPGSLQNVVEDVTRRVVKERSGKDGTEEKSEIRYAQAYVPHLYEFDDPRIEESYTLERHNDGSSEWEYVETFHPKFVDEDYLDDDPDSHE